MLAAVCARISMCVACLCCRAFHGFCFSCVFASPPSLPHFSCLFFSAFPLIFQCGGCSGVLAWGGGGLVAGVRVGKATGVVYLPGLGFMCSPGGGGG